MSKIENPIQSQSSTDINTYSPQETISNISEIEINKKLLSSIAKEDEIDKLYEGRIKKCDFIKILQENSEASIKDEL